jgi:nitroimidazol reductase NimA-like FMN-containing flavoprotein (pyridoxamine 5'-phosphate oxidase superfamily)
VAYVVAGEVAPQIIPQLHFVKDNFLYLHGNRQSALLNHLLDGGEVAVSVLLVDGIVVARSGFHCSMNYRSVSLFGAGQLVEGGAEAEALDLFVEALIPGHNEYA